MLIKKIALALTVLCSAIGMSSCGGGGSPVVLQVRRQRLQILIKQVCPLAILAT